LYAPTEKAYTHLKAAVSDGPSIVFTRYHEAGATGIRSHQYPAAKPCKRILGYDANAFYLSTMLKDMPCRKEKLTDYEDPAQAAPIIKDAVLSGQLFGFVKCKLVTPKKPMDKIRRDAANLCEQRGAGNSCVTGYVGLPKPNRTTAHSWKKKLLGVFEADEIELYTPLLRRYIEHELELQAVCTTIKYQPENILAWFVEQITEARRMEDVGKEKNDIRRGLQTSRQQLLWKNDRSSGKAHQCQLHKRRGNFRPCITVGMVRRPHGSWSCIRDNKPEAAHYDTQTISGWNCCVPASQAKNSGVLS